jgi:hypothetical protein
VSAAPVLGVILAAACGTLAACGRQPRVAEDIAVEWTITPTPPVVGAAALAELRLRDGARRPVRGATLRIEAHMSHPGMAPIVATAVERGDGVYQAELRLTMRGSWILLVSGELPDGRRITHRIDVDATGPPG